jgi:hypothetical protein
MKIRVFLFICVLLVSSVAYAQLTESERRGKAIYLRGDSTSGRKITAMLGDLDVPASTMTCGGCHGLRGEGKTEGGVTAGKPDVVQPTEALRPHASIGTQTRRVR